MKSLALAVLLVVALSVDPNAQDARAVIDDAARAMGTAGLNAITYSGIAAVANFGQSRTISFGLASATIRNYTRTIDFTQPGSRVTGYVVPPAIQGGPPVGDFEEVIGAGDTSWAQQLEVWITPWGFLRGAAAGAATVKSQKIDGTAYKVVSWTPRDKAPSGQSYRLVGYINPQNLVDRVETWAGHPVLGDLHIDTRYSNYLDSGGLKFPGRVTQRRVGMEMFVAAIAAARANPPELAQLMAASRRTAGAAPAASAVASEKLADGVYLMTGGYTALAVELRDYAVVVGGGGPESYGQALLAEAKRLMPKKPIRYVVNTHPHFDHAAVLPPFAAEGITILTDDPNRYFLEQALASPRTLVGDALAKSRRRAKVEGVVDKLVLGDSVRSIELRHLPKFEHSDGMLVAYLPSEKILFTADVDEQAPALSALQLSVGRHIMVGPPNQGGR